MTIGNLLTESKFALNTPNYIIKRFDDLINNKNIKPKQKKVLQEIKGILIGKYPTEQSLKNSLKGVKNKVDVLNEKVLDKWDRAIYSLVAAITIMSGAIGVKLSSNIYSDPNSKIASAVEKNFNSSKTMAGILTVEVDEANWKKIEDILSKLENELNKGNGLEAGFETLRKDFSDNKIDLVKHPESKFYGIYKNKTDRIEFNVSIFKESARYLEKDNEFIKTTANNIKIRTASMLKHEMTHQTQYKKVNFIVQKMIELRYSNIKDSYEKQMIEVGAYYAQIKQRMNDDSEIDSIRGLDQDKSLSQVLRNIVEVYPESDQVIKAIKSVGKNYKNLDSTLNITSKQSAKMREYIQLLQDNKSAIEIVRNDLNSKKG